MILSTVFETKKTLAYILFFQNWNNTLISKNIYLQVLKTGKHLDLAGTMSNEIEQNSVMNMDL